MAEPEAAGAPRAQHWGGQERSATTIPEAPMSDPFDTYIVMWMIQRKGANGKWWTIPSMVRRTRSEAIGAFKECYVNGDKIWTRERNRGEVRCVWGPLYCKSN
jgi:hypothetical protein